jgi:hypothetical protein
MLALLFIIIHPQVLFIAYIECILSVYILILCLLIAGMAMLKAGLSTVSGFLLCEAVQNLLLKDCWTDVGYLKEGAIESNDYVSSSETMNPIDKKTSVELGIKLTK